MDSVKIKEAKYEEEKISTIPIQSLTVDTIGSFGPLDGPNGIGKRKFMITDILNNSNKLPCTRSGSPRGHQGLLYHHSPPSSFVSSAFQNLSSSANTSINSSTSSISSPSHFDLSAHHPAAAAAAMAAIGAAGTDLRMYSNFLPAAALQQIQQHREQLMMNHQRANSDNDDRDDTPAPNSNDVDVEEDTQGDSEGK